MRRIPSPPPLACRRATGVAVAVTLAAPRAPLSVVLQNARRRLIDAGIDDAALDARLIVEHCTGTTRLQAISEPDRQIDAVAVHAVEQALARRAAGEPVHRILGFREFYGLRLALSAGTLEPRPDTETLVEAVLPFVKRTIANKGGCRILDLGTGTGAIALALLSAVPQAMATGIDLCDDALETAAKNAAALGLDKRFEARKSDWFAQIQGRWDAIVSNPPYIESEAIGTLQREVRDFDPVSALDGGADGLDAYRAIATGAAGHLEPCGVVAVEIGSTQKAALVRLFEQNRFLLEEAYRDLASNDRVLVFKAG